MAKTKGPWQPKTGAPCACRRGIERDNCPACEGTGQRIDFAAIWARNARPAVAVFSVQGTGETFFSWSPCEFCKDEKGGSRVEISYRETLRGPILGADICPNCLNDLAN